MPKGFEGGFDEFLSATRNPLLDSGLSPDAIKALTELEDGEALQTALQGVYRALSRSLHPDVAGGEASDYYHDLIDAHSKIRGFSADEIGVLAKDVNSGKKKAQKKPEVIKVDNDKSPALLAEIARLPAGEFGPTFAKSTGIEIDGYIKRQGLMPSRLLLHRVDDDEFSLRNFEYVEIENREIIDGIISDSNELGHEAVRHLAWQGLVADDTRSALKRGYLRLSGRNPKRLPYLRTTVSGVLFCDPDGVKMFDAHGELVQQLDQLPPELAELDSDGEAAYKLTLKVAKHDEIGEESHDIGDDLRIEEAKLVKVLEPHEDATSVNFRILGSAKKALASGINRDMKLHVKDATQSNRTLSRATDKSRLSEERLTLTNSNALTALGFPLHEKYAKNLPDHFSAEVSVGNDLIVADPDGALHIFGRVQALYKDLYS